MREETHYKLKFKKLFASDTLIVGDNIFDWTIEQVQYNSVNVSSYMTGVQYEIKNSNVDDEIKFQVVDTLGNLLNEFADVAAIDGTHYFEQYLSLLPTGMKLRLIYKKAQDTDVIMKCNLIRHINVKGAT
jgi:hypothetical protein